jgi:3-oxoacyl-[acyl-carrier protein] reductase
MAVELTIPGRIAVVTGASAGIGLAIARGFASAGARVAVVARNPGPLDDAVASIRSDTGAEAIGVQADVSTAEGCAQVIAQVEAQLGAVDILVNNAGSSARSPFVDVTDEQWQADLDLKLFGAIRLVRSVFPGMRERKFGRIINILNTGAKAPPAEGAPTAVSRAAGMALTKILAGEGAPDNVLVNAMLVGKIRSAQWERRHAAQEGDETLEAYYARMGSALPMGRYGTAEEFANMAVFLASDAGSYITGTAINVDGGMAPVV